MDAQRLIRLFSFNTHKESSTMRAKIIARAGKITWGLAALLLGLPVPVIIIALLAPGCR
jgi:hypothetical protein